jgi:penicillin-binding protein 2
MAVNVSGGTANRARVPGIEIAAKTGTAQTVDMGQKSHNSWLVSFAPYDNPQYAVCVMVQNAGSGGAVCGPLVHLVYHGLLSRNEGVRLPLRRQTEFAGNTNRIEEITLPEELLAAIKEGQPDDMTYLDEPGETGDEAVDAVATLTKESSGDESVTPVPTLTPEIDDEGTVIPRAVPVPDP